MLDISQVEESITLRRPPLPPSSKEAPEDLVILRTDSLAERARKMQLKKQSSLERENSRERSQPRSVEKFVFLQRLKRIVFTNTYFIIIREKSPTPDLQTKKLADRKEKEDNFLKSKEVQLLLQVR